MNHSLRILVVEDSPIDAKMLLRILEQAGFELVSLRVQTAEAMKEALETQTWDLITCDYNMPNFDAPQALELYKSTGLDIPFIVVSGAIGEEIAVQMMKNGAHDYLMKRDLARFVPAVQRELRETQERRERKRAEQALHREKAFTEAVLDSIPGLFYLFNDQGQLVRWNKKVEEMTGHSELELVRMHVRDWHKQMPDEAQISQGMQKVMREGHGNVELTMPGKNGRTIPYYFTGVSRVIDGRTYLAGIGIDITDRKQMEEALREKTLQTQMALEAAQMGIWQWDIPNDQISVVQGKGPFSGLSAPVFPGNREAFLAMVHPEDRERVFQNIRQAVELGKDYLIEFRALLPDGTQRWVFSLGRCSRDAAGQPLKMTGADLDITDRKRAEEALRRSEGHLRKILEQSPMSMAIVGMDGTIEYINKKAVATFGYRLEEIPTMERWWLQAYPDESYRKEVVASWMGRVERAVTQNREIEGAEYQVTCKDGSVRTSFIFGVVISDKVFVMFDDITARKQVEEALKASERRFRSLYQYAPIGVAVVSLETRFLQVNPAFCTFLGYSEPELLSKCVGDVTHPDDMEISTAIIRRVASGQLPPQRIEKRYQHKQGGLLWGETNLSVVHDAAGQPAYLIAQVLDITERKQAQERLESSRQQLRALSARVQSLREEERTRIAREIHDHLGQLLTALKMDLHSLDRKLGGLEKSELQGALVEKVFSATGLTNETIKSVQKIAMELRPGVLDRLGLAAAIEAESQAFQVRTGIPCTWTVPADPFDLSQDRATGLFRIFQEILTNIVRHARAAHVTVRLDVHAGEVTLEVKDDGVGIRAGDVANPKSLGILGMQERAALLNGRISFTGHPGQGSTVIVSIPIEGKERETP